MLPFNFPPQPIKTRIAPTPSGYLHIGNAYSFLLTWIITQIQGGELFLRIDDIDSPRIKDAYLDDIFHTLDWLNITYDKGPENVKDFKKNHSQQLRIEEYQYYLNKLKEKQKLFTCNCSRSEIKKHSTDGQYPMHCRTSERAWEAPQTAWRIITPNQDILIHDLLKGPISLNLFQTMRDFVVRRKEGIIAYQIVSLIEDIKANINLIVRGEDLLSCSAAQLLLAKELGLSSFQNASFIHHSLIMDKNGQHKLSKSKGAASIKELRQYHSPSKVYQLVAQHMKWESHGIETLEDLLNSAQERLLQ
ncbi:glutamate--tRNA ligase family protein [Algivirga pacifica]|uniref:Glutamyl/glutaminyl-tRNA synthetase class Ib catalytic domain-containing protein n=1 Tax=Algivirga pacifica TaxID=1162670 RepID=A0ABP9D1S6_9BACT